jgi:hypothetical protein
MDRRTTPGSCLIKKEILKRGKDTMTEQELSYAEQVEKLMEQWNCRIEQMENASRYVSPKQAKRYDEAISSLIALREATRRGLVEVEEAEATFFPESPSNATEAEEQAVTE